MLGIRGPDPSFAADDGCADPAAATALAAFAAGIQSEHAALTALARGRLLVPIVAMLAGDAPDGARPADRAGGGEKASEMAVPALIGLDGRRAMPAFTCMDSLQRWQPAARPVPVAARQVWQAAVSDSMAVVIDIAGPVPFAVEGARLEALASGEQAPPPHEDADIRKAVAAVLAGEVAVRAFRLGPGGTDHDLVLSLALAAGTAHADLPGLAERAAEGIMAKLGGRLRRGVAIAFAV